MRHLAEEGKSVEDHTPCLAARRAGAKETRTFDRSVKHFTEFEVLADEAGAVAAEA